MKKFNIFMWTICLLFISFVGSLTLVRNSIIDLGCNSIYSIGLVGLSGECKGKLIVNNELLRELIEKNENYSSDKIYTGNVTDMSDLFKLKNVNYYIADWNVSNVVNMQSMFEFSEEFNQPILNWNVSNVVNMQEMFSYARSFNQPIGMFLMS